jgi:hypothetical protein
MNPATTGARVALMMIAVACGPRVIVRSPAATTDVSSAMTLVSLERKPCYGTCPVYKISVTGDGAVVWDGRANVDSMGRKSARLDGDQLASLIRLFDAQFYSLDDRYVNGGANCQPYASDAPVIVTSIVTSTRTKTVERDAGCASAPPRLAELEGKIDALLGTARWIGRR